MGINEEVTNKGKKSFGKGRVLGSWLREAGYEAKTQRRGVEKTDIGTQRHRGARAKTRSWEGCLGTQRHRGARAKTPGCKRGVGKGVLFSQRHWGASAKTPGCKRGVGKG